MKKTSKLYVNGRFLTQRVTGVQAFAREICRELINESELTILVPRNRKCETGEFKGHVRKIGFFSGHIWEQLSLPLFVLFHPGSVLINLCNTGPLLLRGQIITIHDLAITKDADWFHPLFRKVYSFLVPRLIKKCSLLITVTQTVKKEIAKEYSVSESKIIVLGNKVSKSFLGSIATAPKNDQLLAGQFFLMVGSENTRKNFRFVENLFAGPEINKKLVIAGGSHISFNRTTFSGIESNRIIHLGYIDEENLKWLYEHAIALINPSHYEGFGIPNLEAMTFGCPVLCSDIPVFHEVCNNAALYFDLNSVHALKKCIAQILGEESLLHVMKSNGKTRSETFQKQNRAEIILGKLNFYP